MRIKKTSQYIEGGASLSNVYGTSDKNGYTQEYINNNFISKSSPQIKVQKLSRSITQPAGADYWVMTQNDPLVIPTGYSILGVIVTNVPSANYMEATATVTGSNVIMHIYNYGSFVTGTAECKVLYIKNN